MQRAIQAGGKIFAARLKGGLGLAQFPTQPDTTFLDELSGRIRVIACLDEPPIVLSGALMPEFPDKHKSSTGSADACVWTSSDDFFIVFGPEDDCRTAVEEIRLRFVDALKGVPKETRQALVGGFTTFERILPGPDRMYPDTDSPPTRITAERVAEARRRLRPPPWERFARYGALARAATRPPSSSSAAAAPRSSTPWSRRPAWTACWPPSRSASGPRPCERAGIPIERLGEAEWVQVFDLFTDGSIPREAIQPVAAHMAKNPGVDAAAAGASLGFGLQDRAAWTKELRRTAPWRTTASTGDNSDEKRLRFLASARPCVSSAGRPRPRKWPSTSRLGSSRRCSNDHSHSANAPTASRATAARPGASGALRHRRLERSGDRQRPRLQLQGRDPAPQRDLRRPPHRGQALQRLQRGRRRRPHRDRQGDSATARPSTRSPRRTSPSTPARRASRCWAPAAPSPRAWTTAPAR